MSFALSPQALTAALAAPAAKAGAVATVFGAAGAGTAGLRTAVSVLGRVPAGALRDQRGADATGDECWEPRSPTSSCEHLFSVSLD